MELKEDGGAAGGMAGGGSTAPTPTNKISSGAVATNKGRVMRKALRRATKRKKATT